MDAAGDESDADPPGDRPGRVEAGQLDGEGGRQVENLRVEGRQPVHEAVLRDNGCNDQHPESERDRGGREPGHLDKRLE